MMYAEQNYISVITMRAIYACNVGSIVFSFMMFTIRYNTITIRLTVFNSL